MTPSLESPLSIRPARPGDVPALVALFTAAVHRLAAGAYDEAQRAAWAPLLPDLSAWQRRFAALSTRIAVDGTDSARPAPAGFIAWQPNGLIDLLFCAPDRARRGVASALLATAAAELAAQGVHRLSTEASLVARPFFARHGFVVVEEQTVVRGGQAFRRFAMQRAG